VSPLKPETVDTAMGPSKLMTADELAERWCVLPQFVYLLARRGDIPCVHLGKYRRFRLEDILDFEARGGTAEAGR
jgi:hypothetical protein